jgi:hypothetical protein
MNETNKEKNGNGEATDHANGMFEASPKTGYTVTLSWAVN